MNTLINNTRICIDNLAQNVVQLLCGRNLCLCTAESCTGGLLSGAVTSVSGASNVFGVGICAYSNGIKEKTLCVKAETLENYGAVSAECAAEMALGIRKISGSEIGVSVTGIAGPEGGTPEKPVGTVFFACSFENEVNILHLRIDAGCVTAGERRNYIRLESVRQALILIQNTICSRRRNY